MKQPKTGEQTKAAYIGAAAIIVAAIIGGIFAYLANNHPTPSPSSSHTVASSTSLTSIPPTTTPVLSPTATSKVIPINQTMNCTNCTSPGFFNFSLKVKSATIDPAKGQVTLLIEVDNIASTSQTVFFTYLKLQDLQTAAITNGGGDGFSSFDVPANSSSLVRPTFQFIPVVGHEYSLTASIFQYIFSPITIKFG